MADWRLVWCTAPLFTVVDEIPAYERKFNFRLNQANTIEFKVSLEERMGMEIASAPYGFGWVKLYRDSTLMMVAETTSIQIVGKPGEKSVGVVCTEMAYPQLSSRVIAYDEPLTYPTATTQGGTTMMNAITANLGASYMATGSAGTTSTVEPSVWDVGTTVLDLIEGLALRASGFDFWFEYAEPTTTLLVGPDWYAQKSATARAAPIKGTTKPNAIFEYGIGRNNIAEYTMTSSAGDHLCTQAIVRGTSVGNNTASAVATAAFTPLGLFGVRQRFFAPDASDPDLMQDYADLYISKRAYPRLIFGFTPAVDGDNVTVPQFWDDYDVGDIVTGRVFHGSTSILDAEVRVYGVEVNIDINGSETTNLTLTPDTDA